MLSIPKYLEQYAQHFPTIFYLLCCASQHHVLMSLRSVFIFAIASICTSCQISKGAQTNRDKITPDMPALTLSWVFSRTRQHTL